jgi:proteic killer suppression protein
MPGYRIVEQRDAAKTLDKLPSHVLKHYEAWKAIVRTTGPEGLRAVKGFHDEKMAGRLSASRSSRLNQQWRVIYRVSAATVTVTVERTTPHEY